MMTTAKAGKVAVLSAMIAVNALIAAPTSGADEGYRGKCGSCREIGSGDWYSCCPKCELLEECDCTFDENC
jgi:hypothetical protein